ncbi:MAG: arginine deiminase family protein [Balneolaceae bacterium]
MQIGIFSETSPLRKVITHTPGREVSLVSPECKDELLFDDIIFEEDAREEHLNMLDIFKAAMPKDGEVIEILDLARDCLSVDEQRLDFVETMVRELTHENLHIVQNDLKELDADALLRFIVHGRISDDSKFTLLPTPNILFTRDLAAVVGTQVIVSKAAKAVRARESLLMKMIVRCHPLFSGASKIIEPGSNQSIEGGDVLVASEHVALIGMSERTSFSGLMSVAEQLLQGDIDHVLAVDIPKKRSSMHLDTIFTFADKDECIVYPPAIEQKTDNVVELFRSGSAIQSRGHKSLQGALEELHGHPFHFIRCGGNDPTTQHREQWTDGANVFALAPGVIVGYERNTNTFEELHKNGYRVMTQFEFIGEFGRNGFHPEKEGKIAISFQGHELCRGRGGARCMTQPILRI